MRNVLLWIFAFLPVTAFSQADIRSSLKQSHQAFVYRITLASAEKFIKQDSIDIDAYLLQTPFAVFPADSIDEAKLPTGQYLSLSVVDNRIDADLFGRSDLFAYPINNEHRVQLIVIDKSGKEINDAIVTVNGIASPFTRQSQSYAVFQKKTRQCLNPRGDEKRYAANIVMDSPRNFFIRS